MPMGGKGSSAQRTERVTIYNEKGSFPLFQVDIDADIRHISLVPPSY